MRDDMDAFESERDRECDGERDRVRERECECESRRPILSGDAAWTWSEVGL